MNQLVALVEHGGLDPARFEFVIAEGVETEGQRDALLRAGCRKFQGYLTGKPMPASELTQRLAGTKAPISQPVP